MFSCYVLHRYLKNAVLLVFFPLYRVKPSSLEHITQRARIYKRLRSSGIDSKESISPAYEAGRAGMSNRLVVPACQARNRFQGSLKGYKYGLSLYRETLDMAQFCRGYKLNGVEVPGTRVTGSRVTNARLGLLQNYGIVHQLLYPMSVYRQE